jgi:hypothetical protein
VTIDQDESGNEDLNNDVLDLLKFMETVKCDVFVSFKEIYSKLISRCSMLERTEDHAV